MTPLGEGSEVCAWFSPDFTPFPFADFAFYPFTVINHSHKYDYMPGPACPPSESMCLRDGLGDPQHIPKLLYLAQGSFLRPRLKCLITNT